MNEKRVNLSSLFYYPPLKKYEGLVGDIYCRAPTTYVGVEIELEQVKWIVDNCPSSFRPHDDGSLKLNGKEFVTIPIPFGYLEQELTRLTAALAPPLISSRCSIHVHLNVRNFSLEELHKFLLLYLIFERNLFRISGDRYTNNFCTPLHSYPPVVANFLKVTAEDFVFDELPTWYKYFALNLSPIWGGETRQVLGTAEFRHSKGTLDVKEIVNWINFIVSLKIAAIQIDKEELYRLIKTMNTTSHYYWLADYVFKGFAKQITSLTTFKGDIEQDILSTKVMLFDKREKKMEVRPTLNPIPTIRRATIQPIQRGDLFATPHHRAMDTLLNELGVGQTIDTIIMDDLHNDDDDEETL